VTAGGGAGDVPGESPVDHAIRELVRTGRPIADNELDLIRRHVAAVGFDPHALETARTTAAGVNWHGSLVQARDRLPPVEAHYLRHVVKTPQWPPGTTLSQYVESITRMILDPDSGVFVSFYQDALQFAFIGRSGSLQGPGGERWVVVEYRVDTRHWVTAHQIALTNVYHPRRRALRWLRRPR
jgi:hypothetical protein